MEKRLHKILEMQRARTSRAKIKEFATSLARVSESGDAAKEIVTACTPATGGGRFVLDFRESSEHGSG